MAEENQEKKTFFLPFISVVALLAICVVYFISVFPGIRENNRDAICVSTLKQISFLLENYSQDFDGHLPMNLKALSSYSVTDNIMKCPSSKKGIVDFELVLPGWNLKTVSLKKTLPLVYEKGQRHQQLHILFADGHVESFSVPDWQSLVQMKGWKFMIKKHAHKEKE